jgi:hypothetical protein
LKNQTIHNDVWRGDQRRVDHLQLTEICLRRRDLCCFPLAVTFKSGGPHTVEDRRPTPVTSPSVHQSHGASPPKATRIPACHQRRKTEAPDRSHCAGNGQTETGIATPASHRLSDVVGVIMNRRGRRGC